MQSGSRDDRDGGAGGGNVTRPVARSGEGRTLDDMTDDSRDPALPVSDADPLAPDGEEGGCTELVPWAGTVRADDDAGSDSDRASADDAPPLSLWRRPLHVPARLTRLVRALLPLGTAVVAGMAVVAISAPTVTAVNQLLTPAPDPVQIVQLPDEHSGAAVELYEKVQPAVVTLFSGDTSGGPDSGVGSGFFIRPGVVATNLHVVSTNPANATDLALGKPLSVRVVLADGRERTGTVAGYDERLDVALVEVEDAPQTPVLGFATETKVGTPVWAFGAPFGLAGTMTGGAVTGVDVETAFRVTPVQASLLQTDASVNPGNSGGPLVAIGEDGVPAVVGMVTLRPDESAGRSVQGITFALPAVVLVDVLEQLEVDGKVAWPFLGLAVSPTTPDDELYPAVLIEAVTEGFGAEEAGVEEGDVLTAIDGVEVVIYSQVTAAVRGGRPGDTVTLTVIRDGAEKEIDVVLSERPDDQ